MARIAQHHLRLLVALLGRAPLVPACGAQQPAASDLLHLDQEAHRPRIAVRAAAAFAKRHAQHDERALEALEARHARRAVQHVRPAAAALHPQRRALLRADDAARQVVVARRARRARVARADRARLPHPAKVALEQLRLDKLARALRLRLHLALELLIRRALLGDRRLVQRRQGRLALGPHNNSADGAAPGRRERGGNRLLVRLGAARAAAHEEVHEDAVREVRLAAHAAHEEQDVKEQAVVARVGGEVQQARARLCLDVAGHAEPRERAVHLGQREQPVVIAVKQQEGVMQQQPARTDRLAHAHAERLELEQRPLVLHVEEPCERRLLPPLGEAAAAADDHREEEAARGGRHRQRREQQPELGLLVMHRRVDEAEAVVADCRLVLGGGRQVGRRVEHRIVRRDAAQREADVGAVDERLTLTHVQDAADRLGLREAQQHKVAAVLGGSQHARRQDGGHLVEAEHVLPAKQPVERRLLKLDVLGGVNHLPQRLAVVRARAAHVEQLQRAVQPRRLRLAERALRRVDRAGHERRHVGHPLEDAHSVLDAPLADPLLVEVVARHRQVGREGKRRARVQVELGCRVEAALREWGGDGRATAAVARLAQRDERPALWLLVIALVGDVHVPLHLDLLLLLLLLRLLLLLLAALLRLDVRDADRRADRRQDVVAPRLVLLAHERAKLGRLLAEDVDKRPLLGHTARHRRRDGLHEDVERLPKPVHRLLCLLAPDRRRHVARARAQRLAVLRGLPAHRAQAGQLDVIVGGRGGVRAELSLGSKHVAQLDRLEVDARVALVERLLTRLGQQSLEHRQVAQVDGLAQRVFRLGARQQAAIPREVLPRRRRGEEGRRQLQLARRHGGLLAPGRDRLVERAHLVRQPALGEHHLLLNRLRAGVGLDPLAHARHPCEQRDLRARRRAAVVDLCLIGARCGLLVCVVGLGGDAFNETPHCILGPQQRANTPHLVEAHVRQIARGSEQHQPRMLERGVRLARLGMRQHERAGRRLVASLVQQRPAHRVRRRDTARLLDELLHRLDLTLAHSARLDPAVGQLLLQLCYRRVEFLLDLGRLRLLGVARKRATEVLASRHGPILDVDRVRAAATDLVGRLFPALLELLREHLDLGGVL
mmetsp:Transcript_51097/g.135288  ORF Transcript_51097/g.135288 Transcript_51097/m.135288 type:complete len:1120 (-) Transcript_51097:3197-6556(-)